MKIKVNGEHVTTCAITVAEIISELSPTEPFVIAVNGRFIPKTLYQNTHLNTNDSVDIVIPVFGG